ncbi:hypothetical protein ACIQUG_33845 [Ensifer sp. NPDC090286]|uniref:hypothetical protein n=1 Tax=Ensifer sp. NPDC090286 TaxID=3363991 RepID=UPI000B664DAB|nr:hypothetical protein B9J07_34165 [Sinorhizobium sp. LM21]
MDHQHRDQLRRISALHIDLQHPELSREQRLIRWAQLLDQMPERRLNTLFETEFQPSSLREALRREGSPISVAFDDCVLRDAGLRGDSYGEAKRFFGLSDLEMHQLVCSCHSGETVRSGTVAECVRAVAEPSPSLLSMLMNALLIFRRE